MIELSNIEVQDNISFLDYLDNIVTRVHKYLYAYHNILKDLDDAGLLTVYKAQFVELKDLYLTTGVIGLLESAEFLEYKIKSDDKDYKKYCQDVLGKIHDCNIRDAIIYSTKDDITKWNTELVPAESAGVKLYNWDKKDGYVVNSNRVCYNSYFFPSEDTSYNPIEKIKLHGYDFIKNLDGGSACHINMNEILSQKQYMQLMKIAIKYGCSYFTFNVPMYACDNELECGYVSKYKVDKCPKCGATVTPCTRIIGYLKKVSNFSEVRQKEEEKRYFATKDSIE